MILSSRGAIYGTIPILIPLYPVSKKMAWDVGKTSEDGENTSGLDVIVFMFSIKDSSNLGFLSEACRLVMNREQGREKMLTLFCSCVFSQETGSTNHAFSSTTEGVSAKAITVSIQWQLVVHSKPSTSNSSIVIVKTIMLFFFSPLAQSILPLPKQLQFRI